jgi:predicted ATP-grasp superfamily ATP-dependent carboligase
MPLEGAVLVPGCDDAALWLADLPHGDLGSRFRVSSSPRASLKILQNKSLFGRYLGSTAIPHPRTFTISSAADVAAVPFDSLDRVFVKPADSQAFNAAFGAKGIWADSRAGFEAIWHRLDQRGFKLIAQEYVPGTSADHYFIDGFRDANGTLTGLFARRRWRIHPADFGNSSYCESVPLQQLGAAVGHLETLLTDLQYRGIFSAEFKRDARDGRLCILEVNTRAWWYVEFAARCGVNVCAMAYQDAQGLPVTRPRRAPVNGAGCVRLDDDFKAVRRLGASRSWWRAAWQWARAHHHVFRWDDPRPAWSLLWNGLRRHMTQAFKPAVTGKVAALSRGKRAS